MYGDHEHFDEAFGTYFSCKVDELCMMDNGCIYV
jgi:hypothetical protein